MDDDGERGRSTKKSGKHGASRSMSDNRSNDRSQSGVRKKIRSDKRSTSHDYRDARRREEPRGEENRSLDRSNGTVDNGCPFTFEAKRPRESESEKERKHGNTRDSVDGPTERGTEGGRSRSPVGTDRSMARMFHGLSMDADNDGNDEMVAITTRMRQETM